ncbi:hypothetical protein HIM_05255 [Hirsutella minnesotensis 3608]|uniref:SET domain-containing protein n=1 Tax=Hirsutella minnesotensis 3608 TaxID=1043627 RepID=A0A0F8A5H3_9HYPO|nr:hypothetical protein HIM_05255 [Hirsutella minnesotensis 3608]
MLSIIITSSLTALAAATSQQLLVAPYECPLNLLRQPECRSPTAVNRNISSEVFSSNHSSSSSSPWSFQGECFSGTESEDGEQYCVFASQSFSDGRGISIITTPERARRLEKLPAFTDKAAMARINTMTPPFEERALPGRGFGIIANKTLYRGDPIFVNTPMLILDSDAYTNVEEDEMTYLQRAAVRHLPQPLQDMFWALHHDGKMDPVKERINLNAFEFDLDDEQHYIVNPEISRTNHDCRPNAVYFFDEDNLTQYVHAATTITPGTEITITYINPLMKRDERFDQLAHTWGFNCSCSACSLHPQISAESDSRLSQMDQIEDRLSENPTGSPQLAELLISMTKQERLDAFMGTPYRLAAKAYCAEAQHWKTVEYARLALEYGLLDEGFDAESTKDMRNLIKEPQKQSCWMSRLR